MIFGRGGVGGVINRVTRQAELGQPRASSRCSSARGTTGASPPTSATALTTPVAAPRRPACTRTRTSIATASASSATASTRPLAFALGPDTTLRAGYEYFHDDRTADRGIPSFQGRPLATDAATFFGNPDESDERRDRRTSLSALVEHRFADRFTLRNRTSYGDYDKFYQNVFPGAVNAAGTEVSISGYNNATRARRTCSTRPIYVSRRAPARLDHTLLVGRRARPAGNRQPPQHRLLHDDRPDVTTSSTFRWRPRRRRCRSSSAPSATDADNHGVATVAAVYVQDQVAFSPHAAGGGRPALRPLRRRLHATTAPATDLASHDGLVSPRARARSTSRSSRCRSTRSYSLSYLPRAGEQLVVAVADQPGARSRGVPQLRGRREVGRHGAAWRFTAAVYRLDRSNVVVPDPHDPSRSILVDASAPRASSSASAAT